MNEVGVQEWVAGYERLWRSPGTASLSEIFTDDATYLPSPWATPVVGLSAIADFWEVEREGPQEEFTLTTEVLAVDGARAVIRAAVDYGRGNRWRDLWVVEYDEDGRCRAFEEWPFAPDQPDGHG